MSIMIVIYHTLEMPVVGIVSTGTDLPNASLAEIQSYIYEYSAKHHHILRDGPSL